MENIKEWDAEDIKEILQKKAEADLAGFYEFKLRYHTKRWLKDYVWSNYAIYVSTEILKKDMHKRVLKELRARLGEQ